MKYMKKTLSMPPWVVPAFSCISFLPVFMSKFSRLRMTFWSLEEVMVRLDWGMITRPIQLVALLVFMFGEVHAHNVPILPSNQAGVVLPLLERLAKDKPKRSIQKEINRILDKGLGG